MFETSFEPISPPTTSCEPSDVKATVVIGGATCLIVGQREDLHRFRPRRDVGDVDRARLAIRPCQFGRIR